MLSHQQLERSDVVANCTMNRERQLAGVNSYERELGFHPIEFLKARAAKKQPLRWLDLCCGSGKALIDAAVLAQTESLSIELVGVDLVGMFATSTVKDQPELVQASLHDWEPGGHFDLITCVHGLHYLGDKLGLLVQARRWLSPDGKFVGHLDRDNIRHYDDQPVVDQWKRLTGQMNWGYDHRTGWIEFGASPDMPLPAEYCGASDQAGSNRTGQPAVNSFYRFSHG